MATGILMVMPILSSNEISQMKSVVEAAANKSAMTSIIEFAAREMMPAYSRNVHG